MIINAEKCEVKVSILHQLLSFWGQGFYRDNWPQRRLSQSLGQDTYRMALFFEFFNFFIWHNFIICWLPWPTSIWITKKINNVCKILPTFIRNCQIFITLFHAVTIYLKRKVFFFVNDAFFYNYLYIFFYHWKPDRCILAKVYCEQLWWLLAVSDLSFTLSKFLQPCDCDKNCWLSYRDRTKRMLLRHLW